MLSRKTCVLAEQENNLRGIWEASGLALCSSSFVPGVGGQPPPPQQPVLGLGGVDLGTPQAHLPGGQPPPMTSGDIVETQPKARSPKREE